MSRTKKLPRPGTSSVPPELQPLVDFFEGAEDGRERFRWTLRDSLDELLDGQRTGRWCYQHLRKTEKTYLGTAIEINLSREFDIDDGNFIDWRIDHLELDCKFSRGIGGWEIPMEMYLCRDHGKQYGKADYPALLVWMNDDTSEWAAGLLRISDARLRWKKGGEGRLYNGDNKRKITVEAIDEIYWLWGGVQSDLPRNLLLHLPAATRESILKPASTGQRRVNDLFRHVQDRLIERAVILTVGQQDDAPKRARDARKYLQSDGIIILGHEKPHRQIAAAMGLPQPPKGFWISTRVVPAADLDNDEGGFFLDGRWWRKATQSDPPAVGPRYPKEWQELQLRAAAT